jgi:hypothetical protein
LAEPAPPGPPAAEEQASPEEIALARELGASGIELYESGAYPEASKQLEHAYRFVKVPTTGLWSARALDKTGDLLGAEARYSEVLEMPVEQDEPQVFADARRAARQELDFLVPRIPKLVIRLNAATPDQVAVTLDDAEVPSEQIGSEIAVNPGERRVVGTMGDRVERVTLDMPERSTGSALLDFTPLPPPATEKPPPSQDARLDAADGSRETWGYVALGVGGASLVTGVVATMLASAQRNDLERNCPDRQCAPEFHGDIDTLNATLSLSLVGYLGAAAGVGVGSYLLFTATDDGGPESSASSTAARSRAVPSRAASSTSGASFAVWLGPASAGVTGRF